MKLKQGDGMGVFDASFSEKRSFRNTLMNSVVAMSITSFDKKILAKTQLVSFYFLPSIVAIFTLYCFLKFSACFCIATAENLKNNLLYPDGWTVMASDRGEAIFFNVFIKSDATPRHQREKT